MADVDRIILERTEDGEHWKVQAEGDEVEGHGRKVPGPRIQATPVEERDGEQLYRVEFGDEDTEGHRISVRWSDGRLKRGVRAL